MFILFIVFQQLSVWKISDHHDPLFRSLSDPMWAVDSRDYQLTQANVEKIEAGGGSILCIENYRPHVDLDRAIMAIRFDEAFIGTQFHPEADAVGMRMYLLREESNISLPQIGEALGGRDHTTVMYGCDKISDLLERDDRLRRRVVEIREHIYNHPTLQIKFKREHGMRKFCP